MKVANFNDALAVLIVCLTFTFAFAGALLHWNEQLVMIALGIFLAKFGDVVHFYYRKAKTEKDKN